MTHLTTTITAVASGKGGVGKTLLAACLGTIANEHHAEIGKALLADFDFGVKGLTFLYGSAAYWKACSGSMIDLLNGSKDPDEILAGAHAFNGLTVIPADIRFERKIDWDTYFPPYERMVAAIGVFVQAAKRQDFRHVIFDTGAGLDRTIVSLAEHVDQVIVVVEPDEISMTAAVELRAELLLHNPNIHFLANKEPDDFPQNLYSPLKAEIVFWPALPFDQRLYTRFLKDARTLALTGFKRTRYKRYVGVLANDIFGLSVTTPTVRDRIFRNKVARIFSRFVGYGSAFLIVLILVLGGIAYWATS